MTKRMVIENGERIVHFERAPGTPLRAKERKQLEALANMSDDEINYSDIPPTFEEDWLKHGVVGRFFRPIKQPVTMRLDADVVAWLKSDGKGYQTKANHLLRQQMIAELRKPRTGSKSKTLKPSPTRPRPAAARKTSKGAR